MESRFKSALMPVVVIVCVVLVALFAIRRWGSPPDRVEATAKESGVVAGDGPPRVGAVVADLSLKQFGSDRVISLRALPAKVVMLNFWATWCDACVLEMPSIVKVHAAYASKGFDVIPISVDDNPSEVLPRAIKRLAIDFPVFLDPRQAASSYFAVEGIPLTVILDQNRKILLMDTGENDWNGNEFRSKLERWLGLTT